MSELQTGSDNSVPACLGCGHAKRNHINGSGLCLVKSCRLCLIYRSRQESGWDADADRMAEAKPYG